MILRRFYDDNLAQASYLVGCAATGEALIVDANRDIAQYIAAAENENLQIAHVTETHIHADFVSGTRELAARTGATLYLSDEGGDDWRYAWAEAAGATLLGDGDTFQVGNVKVEVLHTPGHTPEHLCFVITDTAAADRPMGVFTGDFVFVGDVGRPDLLERAAGYEGTMEAGARQLFASLQRFRALPDYLQVWPAHGAGSACGKALGAVPQSTVGYEKLFNRAFGHETEESFVREVLAGQPEPPKYFAEMKRINREGPAVLGGFPRPRRLDAEVLPAMLDDGATVVDIRPAAAFAAAHIPGTVSIPLGRTFSTWAGWLVPYNADFYLLADDEACPICADEAARDLAFIGLDRVGGWFGVDGLDAARVAGRRLRTVHHVSVEEVARSAARGDIAIVDVRGRSEWVEGHLPGVPNIPLGYLTEHTDQLPRD
ncbi:MAG: MBL fold metallo-hydrolase, partial [Longimicrobiales bacterium]